MSTSTIHDTRRLALDRANAIRFARAELKHRIATGEVFAASVILDPPREAQTWAIGDLLTSQHRWGVQRMRHLLARLDTFVPIAETKALGALTDRQRRMLASELRPTESEDA